MRKRKTVPAAFIKAVADEYIRGDAYRYTDESIAAHLEYIGIKPSSNLIKAYRLGSLSALEFITSDCDVSIPLVLSNDLK